MNGGDLMFLYLLLLIVLIICLPIIIPSTSIPIIYVFSLIRTFFVYQILNNLENIINFLKKKKIEEDIEEEYSLQPDLNEDNSYSDSLSSDSLSSDSLEDNSYPDLHSSEDMTPLNNNEIYKGSSYIDRLEFIMSEDEILEEAMKKWRDKD